MTQILPERSVPRFQRSSPLSWASSLAAITRGDGDADSCRTELPGPSQQQLGLRDVPRDHPLCSVVGAFFCY